MARLARAEIFDPSEIVAVHLIGKTVRSCYLMGVDERSGKNFDHRKRWLEEKLKTLAANFGIDLLAFSCMSNHFHLLLRSRPDVVATWDDTQVALRWWQLCPTRKIKLEINGEWDKVPAAPTEFDLNAIRNDPVRLATIRRRLSDLSWWMRLLCQYIAMRANGEDGDGLGRFWQGRYKAVRILDEESLLACAAYVDLNPIRADMAETLEQSDYTSVQRRVQAIKASASEAGSSGELRPDVERVALESATPPRADAFLAPVTIHERKAPLGPHPSRNGRRSSDKGFLAMAEVEYLEILDWLARDRVTGKRGSTPLSVPPVLERLGIEPTLWSAMVKDFGRAFMNVAGTAKSVSEARSLKTH
ncbi:MAG: hypothetical protein WCK15_12595, partial [Pirellula sp.]